MALSGSTRAAVLAAGLLSLAAAGCGGGANGLTPEQYREQVNQICADFEEELGALESPESIDDVPEYVDRVIPLVEQEIADVRELEPPEEMEAQVEEMLAQAEEAIEAARDLRDAAENEDEQAANEALRRGNEANAEADRIAGELGLDECGN